ncbi:hypothetical protein CPB86DRAFT_302475 [Serendipita vermifera]|nr:hypothetical protein CPB86DRAFT_302475 [Serendipita vermifera]
MSTLLKIPSADSTRIEPVIQISNIFDACTGARDRSINTNGRSDDIIYLILPQILYDLTQGQDNKLVLEKFGLLRHPAVSSAWLDETVNNQFDRTNSIINEYFWDEARPLYPKRGARTPVFSVELGHSILALLSRLPRMPSVGSEAWHMMSSSLMTLGCCISGQPYDERLVRRAPEHDPVLWIARLLGCLKPGMNDPTLAFLISALLMGHVRRLYGRSLYCAPSAEGRDQIRGIDDSLLCLISCLLLGWEFEDFLPAWGDPVWRTPALKVAMDYKNGFGPYILYASDLPLLLAMCSHADEYLENKALWFLTKYTEISLFANQSDMHARKATAEELLKTALPLFRHLNNRQCYQIKLIARWSLRDLFLRPLLDLGGLEWLSGLTLPWPEDCTNCFRFTSPVDGMVLFLRYQIQVHELTPENLPEAQSKLLLESPLLRETFPNSDAHKYIFMVKIIFDHLKELGCSELCFPDTATKCEEVILWDEPQQQRCWEQSRQVLGLIGEGDLEGWMEGLRELVDELRTGKRTLIQTSRFGYSVSPLTGPLGSLDPLTGQRGKERFRMHWRKVGGHAT